MKAAFFLPALAICLGALLLCFQNFSSPVAVGFSQFLAHPGDYTAEPALLSAACDLPTKTCNKQYLEGLVQNVQSQANLATALDSGTVNSNLSNALGFMILDYATNLSNRDLRLPFNAPNGLTISGNVLADDAADGTWPMVYWLGDNGIYMIGVFSQYVPRLGRLVHDAYLANWNADPLLGQMCPTSQSFYAIGIMPDNELNLLAPGSISDSRCQYPIAGSRCAGSNSEDCWHYSMFNMQQTVNDQMHIIQVGTVNGVEQVRVSQLKVHTPLPVIGTDHEQGASAPEAVALNVASARDLFKYGCLRQVMKGHPEVAKQMFAQAMDLWNPVDNGFVNASEPAGIYDTRELAFALMCANALGYGTENLFAGSELDSNGSPVHQVRKSAIESALWALQADDGGMWTNYAGTNYCATNKCYAANTTLSSKNVPGSAKETEEITPLTLLAYGKNIWLPKP